MQIYGIYLFDKIITGGNRRYIELLTSIAKKGVSVTVFVNEILKNEFDGCRVFTVPINFKKHKRVSIQTAEQLKLFLKSNEQCFSAKESLESNENYILIFGETAWKSANVLKKFCSAKIIFAYRSDLIEEVNSFLKYDNINVKKKIFFALQHLVTRYREKVISKKATLIVFQSANDENNFKNRNKNIKAKTIIIPNDILGARFKKEYKDKNESKECHNFLFVGGYDIRKGLIFFLKALVIVKNANISFNASIVCRGEIPTSILDFIKSERLENVLEIIKDISDSLPLMACYDVLIVPSLFDSFPNVIMEALHVGLPVFSSNTSGMPYMLQNEKLLFEVANPDAIAKKLIDCATNTEYYLEIKSLCKEQRKKFEFDWSEKWINSMKETQQDND